MSSVVIDGSAWRAAMETLLGDFHTDAAIAIQEGVDAAAKDAFSTTSYQNHTWKLRSGTKATVSSRDFKGKLENRVKHASYVEFGTKAHVIKPKKSGGLLRWYSHRFGAWISSKGVKHPGTKARLFFQHAGIVGGAEIQRQLAHRVGQHINKFNRAA